MKQLIPFFEDFKKLKELVLSDKSDSALELVCEIDNKCFDIKLDNKEEDQPASQNNIECWKFTFNTKKKCPSCQTYSLTSKDMFCDLGILIMKISLNFEND